MRLHGTARRVGIAVVLLAMIGTVVAFEMRDRSDARLLASNPPHAALVLPQEVPQFCAPGGAIKSQCVRPGPPVMGWTGERFRLHCEAISVDLDRRGIPPRLHHKAREQYRLRCPTSHAPSGEPQAHAGRLRTQSWHSMDRAACNRLLSTLMSQPDARDYVIVLNGAAVGRPTTCASQGNSLVRIHSPASAR